MRTTLDIDEDILLAAKALAEQKHITTGKVLSDLARQSLDRTGRITKKNGIPVLPGPRNPGKVDLALVNRLRDES